MATEGKREDSKSEARQAPVREVLDGRLLLVKGCGCLWREGLVTEANDAGELLSCMSYECDSRREHRGTNTGPHSSVGVCDRSYYSRVPLVRAPKSSSNLLAVTISLLPTGASPMKVLNLRVIVRHQDFHDLFFVCMYAQSRSERMKSFVVSNSSLQS